MTDDVMDDPGPEPEMSPAARMMQHVDAALDPAMRHASQIGTASLSDMGVILRAVRQAMAVMIHGPAPDPEPLVEGPVAEPPPPPPEAA